MLKALEKRPVASEALDAAVVHVCQKLRSLGEREVPSRLVGELAMEELHNLDEVAYVRFASVYRSFQDLEEFREEIDRMRTVAVVRRGGPAGSLDAPGSRQEALMHVSVRPQVRSSDDASRARARSARPLYDASESARRLRRRARRAHRRRRLASQVGRTACGAARARAAGEAARGATVYVTLEPHSYQGRTPPCTEALIRAGVNRVVCGAVDPNPKVAGRRSSN